MVWPNKEIDHFNGSESVTNDQSGQCYPTKEAPTTSSVVKETILANENRVQMMFFVPLEPSPLCNDRVLVMENDGMESLVNKYNTRWKMRACLTQANSQKQSKGFLSPKKRPHFELLESTIVEMVTKRPKKSKLLVCETH